MRERPWRPAGSVCRETAQPPDPLDAAWRRGMAEAEALQGDWKPGDYLRRLLDPALAPRSERDRA